MVPSAAINNLMHMYIPAGSWSDWSECNAACDSTGEIVRTYNITTPASRGGQQCPEVNGAVETRDCDGDPCPAMAVDCVGSFIYGACNATCGGGVQNGTFVVTLAAANRGKDCSYANQSTTNRACNTQQCVDASKLATLTIQVGGFKLLK